MLNKFDEVYKIIMEQMKNSKLQQWPNSQYDSDYVQKGDKISQHDGACGSVVRINKTYQKWLEENQKLSYKKFDFDKSQTYNPVIAELDGNPIKSYSGAQLENIKNEYKGSTRHVLQLPIYNVDLSEEAKNSVYDSDYDFKDLITIDEQNFYLKKNAEHRQGEAKRKSFYVVISKNTSRQQGVGYSMEDLENSNWLIRNSSVVEFFTKQYIKPHFDGSKGEGRILAEVTIKSGEQSKLNEVKAEMIELGKKIKSEKVNAKRERAASSPAKKKQWNETRQRHIQQYEASIAQYQKTIKQYQKQIAKLKSQMFTD